MKRILPAFLLLAFLLLPASAAAADKEVCLTFDKLPALSPMGYWTPRELSNLVLRALEKRGIEAAGFVVQEKIDDDPSGYIVVEDWAKAGHIVGNNTYSYVDLNEVGVDDFLEHIADGKDAVKLASRMGPHHFRYFRYPLLHEGNTESKKKNVAKVLYRADYKTVPATIVTYDYQFNHLLSRIEDDEEAVESLRTHFIEYIGRCIDYAEQQSQEVFGRQIKHIIQLHLGLATAFFIDEVLQLLEDRGYDFVKLSEALTDPAYSTEETYIGPLGLSFVDRVAFTQGKPFHPEQIDITRDEIDLLMSGEKEDR